MNEPSPRPRILQLTRNLPPLRGGMERLNLHVALELTKEFDVAVVGPAGCRKVLPGHVAVAEVPPKPLWRFFVAMLARSTAMARRFRPHIVLGGSGLVAPFAVLVAALFGARSALYVHGLDLIARHPVYRWLWLPAIRRADICIANSRHTASLAASIGVDRSRIVIIFPGVDPVPQKSAPDEFRARFGLGTRPMLLSVGRLIPRKGLLEFVANSLPQIAARFPDVCLVILGDEAPDMLHRRSGSLGEAIRQCADGLGLSAAVVFVGPQDEATLHAAYAAAAVHVFPVREVDDDVEGFGMVAVEAAAHGLPTVAFATGGVPDAVADKVSGALVPAGDYAAFTAAVIELLRMRDRDALSESTRQFAAEFRWERFGERLRRTLRPGSAKAGNRAASEPT